MAKLNAGDERTSQLSSQFDASSEQQDDDDVSRQDVGRQSFPAPARKNAAAPHDPPEMPIAYAPGDEDAVLVLPPGKASGVCPWCQGPLEFREESCLNCRENASALDGVVQPITPISLYARPGALRDWLTFYKSHAVAGAHPAARRAVGRILERFLSENADWLRHLSIDGVITVPSTVRPPPHPLMTLLTKRGTAAVELLGGLSRGVAPLDHNRPNKHAFNASNALRGKRILLLDDVYASGARAQSAAYSLREVGADVAAVCVIGRRYNPGYSERSSTLFARQSAVPFEWRIEDRNTTQM